MKPFTIAALVLTVVTTAAVAQTAQQWPREFPPRPLQARAMVFPPFEVKTLANGLTVVVVSQNEQPAISMRMIVRAGSAQDPKGKLGLAMLTAALLDQGAGARSAQQLAEEVDFMGAALGSGAGTDLSFINAVVMKDDYLAGLGIMADVTRRPTFVGAEIERQRQQALSALKVAAEDPESVADLVIERLIFGFHPYGMPGSGTADTIRGLTRDDFVTFHRQYFVPNNALLAVVGDITSAEAMRGIEQHFGDWARGTVPPFAPVDPPQPTRRVVVIDRPDAVQTEIRVGHLGIPRKHDDFEAVSQSVKILGGEGGNRLQGVLRSSRQLTYGASADLNTYKWSGAIIAQTNTQTPNTIEALRLMVDEFARLQRDKVSENELEAAQAYAVGSYPLSIETPDQLATQVLNMLFYDLPVDSLPKFRERIEGVSPEEIQRIARWFIRPDQLSVVLVGNASAFIDRLKGAGFPLVERVPIGRLDLLSADFLKP